MAKKTSTAPDTSKKISKKETAAAAKSQKEDAVKAAVVDADWSKGSKSTSKADSEVEKKADQDRKRQQKDELARLDEAELAKIKKPRENKMKDKKELKINSFDTQKTDSFGASGIDAALEMMDIVNEDGKPKQSDKIERHPERRVKSAYLAFQEREMAVLKDENPKLRLSQLNQMLQKKWEKSKENPMNQQSISHTSSRQEEREMLKAQNSAKLDSFKTT